VDANHRAFVLQNAFLTKRTLTILSLLRAHLLRQRSWHARAPCPDTRRGTKAPTLTTYQEAPIIQAPDGQSTLFRGKIHLRRGPIAGRRDDTRLDDSC